ncbi:Ty1/Copia family ribonuclease HI [Bosea sp. (in: a-proteobacteria)]|uniref:Ty1/Copia family ribonuclease HI n=1 Tax=Bosea sp. (in: a-proteobacteria) TaxID=1871050 RepID=UPI00403382C2
MQQPTLQHHQAATGLLRYLKRTAAWGLVYSSSGSSQLQGYADADYAGDPDSMRSTSGTVFVLNGAAISWRSQLQTTVAASTTEAETQAAAAATKEALFLRKVLHHLGASCDPIPIFCDNQGAVALIKNPVESSRSRHIAVAHHLARERQARGEVVFTHCPSTEMLADALTKPLSAQLLNGCVRGMGVS